MHHFLTLIPLALTVAMPIHAAGFAPADVCAGAAVVDPQVAPDGSAVVFVLRTCDVATNSSQMDLWYVSTAPGAEPRQLTTDPGADHSPRWSPDGASLAFVSSRGGSPQIWRFNHFFGEPHAVTDHPGGAGGPVWTPDSAHLIFTSRGPGVEADVLAGEDVAVHTDVLYRKGSQWEEGRYQHLYQVDADGGEATGLTASNGDHDHSEQAVSPDGRWLAYVRDADHTGIFSIDTNVWIQPLTGGEPRLITTNPGPDARPAFSPDSETLLTRSILEQGYESGRRRILLWPVAGGEPTELTEQLDRHIFGPRFSGDGKGVEFLWSDAGTWHLARIPFNRPGRLERLSSGDAWVWDHTTSDDGRTTVLAVTEANRPAELWLLDRRAARGVTELGESTRGLRRLTAFNDELIATPLSRPVVGWADAPADRSIQVWYYPPAAAAPADAPAGDAPPPMIVTLHGGPQWCMGYRWDPEVQALAGAGYGVLAVNFTGSMGYGQAFMDAISGDWGGAPYEDLLAAVDWAVAQGLADAERVGITGGSYGGFLAGFAIGQGDQFRAAVLCRAVINQVSEYGTTDEQFFSESDMPGTPWDHPEEYARWSPLTYAPAVHTPTMIIHSDQDHRVPVSQAEEFFTALVRHGVTAELVRFPGEGHGLSRSGTPVHRRERLSHMIRWFDTYLKNME